MIRALLLVVSLSGLALPAMARTMEPYDIAVLRVLDKGTARVEQVELQNGKPMMFGHIQIELRSCQQTLPEDEPESAAYLLINEFKPGAPENFLFRGWMFASNPSLSALEHPLYDVWVISCKNPITKPSNAEAAPAVVMPGIAPAAKPH